MAELFSTLSDSATGTSLSVFPRQNEALLLPHCHIKQEKSYRISMQGDGNLTKAVGIPCKKCMEIRPSAWNSDQ